MNRRAFLSKSAAGLPAFAGLARAVPAPQTAGGAFPRPLALPKPRRQGGMPLMQALNERRTNRNLAEDKLSPQTLSDLLWAAWGVNREDGMRTAPSAVGIREIDLYVFLAEGVYRFDAVAHALIPVLSGDHRAKTGTQAGVGKPPVSLVYVADLEKYASASMRVSDPATQLAWSNAHAGFIAQNVYLFAASEGLGAWFRALIDAPALAKLLNLRPSQKVLYTQSVGKPDRGA
jgi:nitroreductase